MRSKILILLVVVVIAIVGIGVGVALLAARASGGPPAVAHAPSNSDATTHSSTVVTTHPALDMNPTMSNLPAPIVQASNILAAATNTMVSETNWEEKIDEIVGSDEPDTNKVKQLFALFPKLPEDGQEEAAQHLSNLVDDENYAQLGDLLRNNKLSEGVLDELLADALNRPNSLKLPALLDVASDPSHAKRDEAKDLLELYLGEDYGTDWNTWRQNMTNWMQQNPD